MYVINHILDGDDIYYLPVPITGRVVAGYTCNNEQAIDAETTVTIAGGSAMTTAIGVVTIANLTAEGIMDSLVLDSTTLGKVEVGPTLPIKVTLAGGSTNVEVALTLVIDEYHAA